MTVDTATADRPDSPALDPVEEVVVGYGDVLDDAGRLELPISNRVAPIYRDAVVFDKLLNEYHQPVTWERATEIYTRDVLGQWSAFSTGKQTDAEARFGRMCAFDRGFRADHPDAHVTLLTLVAPPITDGGEIVPPVDMIASMAGALANLRKWLYSRFRDREYGYAVVLAGRRSDAMPHYHVVVWVDGPVDRDPFEGIVANYVRRCPLAMTADHPPEKAVILERADENLRPLNKYPTDREHGRVTRLCGYAASQLPYLGGAVASDAQREHSAAVMAASGHRPWSGSV